MEDINWIRFYGNYGDAKFEIGKDDIESMEIETFDGRGSAADWKELRITRKSGVVRVMPIMGSNYEYQPD